MGPVSLLIVKPSKAEVPRHSLASGTSPLPMPWLFGKGTSIPIFPPMPLLSTQGALICLGTQGPCGLAWPSRPRVWPPLCWFLSGQSHCHYLGLLFVSLGVFTLFGQIPNLETAAAAAKSLQSCPTLCDHIDGSPPGSSVPGSLQARILEWVAISFSNY